MLQPRTAVLSRSTRNAVVTAVSTTNRKHVRCSRVGQQPASVQTRRRVLARFKNGADSATTEDTEGTVTGGSTLVPVVFELVKHCPFGHAFALVGDAPQLGQWDVNKALKLEWSEGDVWSGTVPLPLDSPVSFKYVQVTAEGRLVSWGEDLAGGSNLSVLVTPSEEVMSGLQLLLEPTDASDPSHQPHLLARLDTSAILPESAARFKEAQAAQQLLAAQEAASQEAHSTDTPEEEAPAAAAAVAPEAATNAPLPALSDPAEADAIMSADDALDDLVTLQDSDAAAGGAAADGLQEEEAASQLAEPSSGPVSNMIEVQKGEEDRQEAAAVNEQDISTALEQDEAEEDVSASVAAVVEAPQEECTSEAVQDQGLQENGEEQQIRGKDQLAPDGADTHGGGGGDGSEQQPTRPPQAATAAATGHMPPAADSGVAGGGVSAGFEDGRSVGAAVATGLMELGDGETTAGDTSAPEINTPTATTPQPTELLNWDSTPNPTSSSSSSPASLKSHMITSIDLEESDADDVTQGLNDVTPDSEAQHPSAEAMTVTAQESARLAASHHASTDQHDTPDSAATSDSRGSLEGLPTPPSSGAAAVADAWVSPELQAVVESDACRPANPNSKLVTAGPSISSVDPDAPLQDPSKAITEVDSSQQGVKPIDSYEDVFGALVTAAAAAAVSGSYDSRSATPTGGREGAAEAARERSLQLASSEAGPAGDGAPTTTATDGERTGTWTAQAAEAAAASDQRMSQHSSRATEEGQEQQQQKEVTTSPDQGSGGQRSPRNWLQRLFGGGGGDEGGRA